MIISYDNTGMTRKSFLPVDHYSQLNDAISVNIYPKQHITLGHAKWVYNVDASCEISYCYRESQVYLV